MTIRIVLADDHRMFREALRSRLETFPDLAIEAEASNAAEALEAVERVAPDVLVLDIGLPDMNGIEVAQRLRQRHPGVRIVALTGYAERMFVEETIRAGARSYVLKSAGAEELVDAIRAAAAGKNYLGADVTALMMQTLRGEDGDRPPSVLSQREQEVLKLLAAGTRAATIGTQLGISVATVEVHRRNIKQKLGLRTTAELTRYAVRVGLVAA